MRWGTCLLALGLLPWAHISMAEPTGLQQAILAGDVAAVRRLIEAGADVNLADTLGTPLQAVALTDNATIGLLLLEHGATVEAASGGYQMRALHTAASYGHPTMAALLLDRDADVEAKDVSGRTPIVLAATFGHQPVVELLLAHGANIDAADKFGRTPLDLAILRGSRQMAQLLLDHGASVTPLYVNSAAPLVEAARVGRPDLIDLLLARGADPTFRDQDGMTAIMAATANGHAEVVDLLRRHGAKE